VAAAQAVIRVTRAPGEWRDRLRAYDVLIDGARAGAVRPGQTVDFAVAPGEHGVQLTVDWCSSPVRVVRLAAGQWAQFQCQPNGSTLEMWRMFITPGEYIRFEQV
jgi:hypothetical protein